MAKCSIEQKFIFTDVKRVKRRVVYGDYGEISLELIQYGARYTATRIYTRVIRNMKQKQIEDALERECYRCSKLCHPNVVRFLGLYYDQNEHSSGRPPLLVTELVQDTLLSLVEYERIQFAQAPLYIKLSMLLNISSGLWYLHGQNPPIVHGEISPSSIFLTEHLVAKVGNVGLANAIQPAQTDKDLMTQGYRKYFDAPETLQETTECNHTSVDVFSYGGVILYLVNQEWPVPVCDKVIKHRFRKKVILSEVERCQKHLDKMGGYTAVLKPLVEACMKDDPKERAKIEDVNGKLRCLYEPYNKVNNISWRLQSGISSAVTDGKMSKLHDETKITQLHLDQQDKLISSLKVCKANQ